MDVHIGMKVEVSSDENGFEGAWFEAIVIGRVDNTAEIKYYVRYEHFITDEVVPEPLIEEVFLEYMRPIPPQVPLPSIIEADIRVEVLENDCWWRGVIVDTFESPLSMKDLYEVYFPDSHNLLPFLQCQL